MTRIDDAVRLYYSGDLAGGLRALAAELTTPAAVEYLRSADAALFELIWSAGVKALAVQQGGPVPTRGEA